MSKFEINHITLLITIALIRGILRFRFFFSPPTMYKNDFQRSVWSRLSKIFETFDIRSEPNFSNIQIIRFEHVQTLNLSI